MVDLNLKQIDRQNMFQKIVDFPRHLLEGVEIGSSVDISKLTGHGFTNIILAGMGGSAIGGDLTRTFLRPELAIPFEIHRSYGLPSCVESYSLVVCASYSGNTEETLSAFRAALDRNCHIVAITTGGELAKLANQHDVLSVIIPPGLPPRAALGYSFAPLLTIFGRLGLCRNYSELLKMAAAFLEKRNHGFQFESADNLTFQIAQKLDGKLVIIYAGNDLLDTVALRFKGQLCENAKHLAFNNTFPEFNHNELVGWQLPVEIIAGCAVIILRDKDDHPQISKRMAIVTELLADKGVETITIQSEGEERLVRLLSAIQTADYVSYYLALLNGIDPTPIDVINYLKQKLAE
jgi:glucose/mannose-6-phosphate isomerase